MTRLIRPFLSLVLFFGFSVIRAEPESLGPMEPFWRHSAALGPYLETGYYLYEIPNFMTEGDFPYGKRPYPKEVPFADHLSVVRPLGGCKGNAHVLRVHEVESVEDIDLVYRKDDGSLGYRLHLLEPRLRPLLDHGYRELTFVLDNVPYALVDEASPEPFGQAAPPADPGEWRAFVSAVCGELKRILGPGGAEGLRFRLGTEMNTRKRFDGSQEAYLRLYDASLEAVREHFPEAPFGIFNMAGAGTQSVVEQYNVKPLAVADFAARRPDRSAPLSLDYRWAAMSRYYHVSDDPVRRTEEAIAVWDLLDDGVPDELSPLRREIHEFGIAPFGETAKGQFVSAEPGVLGAATLATILWKLHEGGINRLWHWPVFDKFRDADNRLRYFPTGEAWLYQVMDSFVGPRSWLLEPGELESEIECAALAGAAEGSRGRQLMIVARPEQAADRGEAIVILELPEGWSVGSVEDLRFAELKAGNSPFDYLRRRLAQEGLLAEAFEERPGRLGTVREMGAGRAAERLTGQALPEMEALWLDSMTLRPCGNEGFRFRASGRELQVRLQVPSVLVLRWPQE